MPLSALVRAGNGPAWARHRSVVSMVHVRRCKTSAHYISDIEELVKGNQTFRSNTMTAHPMFFKESAKGQSEVPHCELPRSLVLTADLN